MEHGRLIPKSRLIPKTSGKDPNSGGNVLDLACGRGRHTRHFLGLGYRVTAVDRDVSDLANISENPDLEIIETDLEAGGANWPLGNRVFAGVVVSNYLWRPLLSRIVSAVAPGGVLIYQTFAKGNERFIRPRNPDHLLLPGELEQVVAGKLEVIEQFHGEVDTPRPAVIQRLCARRGG
jgi:SAM-dependent methyltransferase